MNFLTQKIRSFWFEFAIEEKLLVFYIISLCNMDFAAFVLNYRRIMYADIVFLFLFVAVLLRMAREKDVIRLNLFLWPLSAMLLFFIPSFLNSVNIYDSLTELAGLIYLATLCIVVSYVISRASGKLVHFLFLWVVTASIVSLVGILAFIAALINKNLACGNSLLFYSTVESMAHHFPRIDSLYQNANMFLTYLHTGIIFAIALFLLNKKRKLLILCCLFLMLVAAFFTGSRRFTGLLLSLFLIVHWYGGRNGRVFLLKNLIFYSFLLFLVLSIISSIWVIFPTKIATNKSTKTIELKINYAYSLHFLQPAVSINMFKKHPFLGVGLGTYNKNFKDNVDWGWLRSSFGFEAYPEYALQAEERTLNFDPHSVFLGVLAESGLFGLFGLIYFFIGYIYLLKKNFIRNINADVKSVISGCVLAGFMGFLLNGIIIDILTMRHFWFMIAVGIAGINFNRSLNVKRP